MPPTPHRQECEVQIRQVNRHFIVDIRVSGEVDPLRTLDEKANCFTTPSEWPAAPIVPGRYGGNEHRSYSSRITYLEFNYLPEALPAKQFS
ncbi:MAG: hypothetical protein WD181_04730 [Solirubrobacterales bacterium]